jgi:hypothetical protein
MRSGNAPMKSRRGGGGQEHVARSQVRRSADGPGRSGRPTSSGRRPLRQGGHRTALPTIHGAPMVSRGLGSSWWSHRSRRECHSRSPPRNARGTRGHRRGTPRWTDGPTRDEGALLVGSRRDWMVSRGRGRSTCPCRRELPIIDRKGARNRSFMRGSADELAAPNPGAITLLTDIATIPTVRSYRDRATGG